MVDSRETMIVKGSLFLVTSIYELPDEYKPFTWTWTSPPREELYELFDVVVREQ